HRQRDMRGAVARDDADRQILRYPFPSQPAFERIAEGRQLTPAPPAPAKFHRVRGWISPHILADTARYIHITLHAGFCRVPYQYDGARLQASAEVIELAMECR